MYLNRLDRYNITYQVITYQVFNDIFEKIQINEDLKQIFKKIKSEYKINLGCGE